MHRAPHILIVEDAVIAQVVLKTQMIEHGCTVDTASDGASALDLALSTHYDIILMDIGLGEGPDGFQVALEIKKQSKINRTTPIMAVTSHGELEYYHKAAAAGMEGYFNKPFKPDDAKTIVDFLKNWQQLDF
jgi:CheY-like chemotaxis protein